MPQTIFISHSSSDVEKIRLILEDLAKQGIEAWASFKDIEPGEIWEKSIEKALNAASHIILFVSEKSIQSEFVQGEVNRALSNGKIVIPVLLEDVQDKVWTRWSTLQFLDFATPQKAIVGLKRLAANLPRKSRIRSRVLVTAGNTSIPTFDGVCHAVKTILGGVETLQIFDTKDSEEQAAKSVRTQRIREYLGEVDIRTTLITEATSQTLIPERLSRLIKEYGAENIIVDLSNGQKITVSVLYAVAAICRIDNIFALEFKTRPPQDMSIQSIKYQEDWFYRRVDPLKEIETIAQTNNIELIYYRELIQAICNKLEPRNAIFANRIQTSLHQVLIDYFSLGDTSDAIQERSIRCLDGICNLAEEVLELWYLYCQQSGLVNGEADTFERRIEEVTHIWCDYRLRISNRNMKGIVDDSSNVIVLNLMLDVQMKLLNGYADVIRKPGKISVGKQDCRLALDAILLCLEKSIESSVLDMPVIRNSDDA